MNKQLEKLEELKVKVAELEVEIKAEQEWKPWKPKMGARYLFVGEIYADEYTWGNDDTDNSLYSVGNCFKTEQEADDDRRRRCILKRLKDMTKGFKPDWDNEDQKKYGLYYNHVSRALCITYNTYSNHQGTIYFASSKDTQAVIDEMDEDIKFLMGVV